MPFGARLATTSLGIKKLAEAQQVLPSLKFSVFWEKQNTNLIFSSVCIPFVILGKQVHG